MTVRTALLLVVAAAVLLAVDETLVHWLHRVPQYRHTLATSGSDGEVK